MSMMRELFGGGNGAGLSGILGNIAKVIQMFTTFAKNPFSILTGLGADIPQNLDGNLEATVNYLKNSGQMSQSVYEQCRGLAEQFQSFLPKKF